MQHAGGQLTVLIHPGNDPAPNLSRPHLPCKRRPSSCASSTSLLMQPNASASPIIIAGRPAAPLQRRAAAGNIRQPCAARQVGGRE